MRWVNRLYIAAAVCAAAAVSPAQAQNIYGLHVGINNYQTAANLRGAVQDAQDVAQALEGFGAVEATVLLNQEATRAAIERHWERLIETVGPDDVIVFSYSGHGGQEHDVNGDEGENDSYDTQDETLVLSDYFPSLPGLNERIIDDQLNFWFQQAVSKGASVVFVVDASLSGNMSRSGAAIGNRVAANVNPNAQREDSLPELSIAASQDPPPNAQGAEVFFFSSSLGANAVLEVDVNGQWRGPLSYAFARALEGAADKNGDGALTRDELADYIYLTVRSLDDTGHSRASLRRESRHGGVDRVALRRPDAVVRQEPLNEPSQRTRRSLFGPPPGLVRIQITAARNPENVRLNMRGVHRVESEPKLVYDADRGDLRDHEGTTIAWSLNQAAFQRVVDKYLVLDIVKQLAARSSLEVQITPDKQTYVIGEQPFLTMGPSDHPWLLAFNLASDGQVQRVFPYHPSEQSQIPLGSQITIQAEVQEPTGADHLIVLSSAEELKGLRATLEDGADPNQLKSFLERLLSKDNVSAAILPFYTRRR